MAVLPSQAPRQALTLPQRDVPREHPHGHERFRSEQPPYSVFARGAEAAVTAAIIGPRTMDQLQDLLAGTDVTLDEVLDRIDAIVPPGVTVNEADAG